MKYSRTKFKIWPRKAMYGRACTCERCLVSDGDMVCPKRMQTEIDRRFTFLRLRYSYRVGEIEGALELGQLERVDEIMGVRRRNAQFLIDGLLHSRIGSNCRAIRIMWSTPI